MWMFGKRGFTSSVAYDPKKDRNKDSQFPQIAKKAGTHILVRARVKEDLEDLRRVCPTLVIETDKSADYSFRAVIPRSKMKKYAALCVDDIDYDSHFKEAHSSACKGTTYQERHSAVMSVWSAMAKLQPYTPYGGYTSSYSWSGTGWSGGGSSKSSSGVGTVSKPKPSSFAPPKAVADVEAFRKEWEESKGALSYRGGGGPNTGYKPGDRVIGYFGEGEVTATQAREGQPDLVTVKPDDDKKKPGKFLSNFLIPADLPEFDEEPEEVGDVPISLEDLADYLVEHPNLAEFPEDWLQQLDDEAFELLTRLQELLGSDATVSGLDVVRTQDEILWENSTDEEKKAWIERGDAIPDKFEPEAVKIATSD